MINEQTDRINLKRFNKNHCDLIYQLDSDPDVMKYITLVFQELKLSQKVFN